MILFAFALALLLAPALGSTDPNGLFTNPYSTGFGQGFGSNLVWQLGSTQTLAWTTALTTYNITLWQQSTTQNRARMASSPIFSESLASGKVPVLTGLGLANSPGQTSKTWLVDTIDLNLDDSAVFLLWINYTELATTSNGFTSAYFNISRNSISSASSAQSATPAPGRGGSPVPSTSAQGVPVQSTSPASIDNSVGRKIGLGVGVAVGVPSIVLLGFLAGLLARRPRKLMERNLPPPTTPRDRYPLKPVLHDGFEAPGSGPMQGERVHLAELEGKM
jgi:hypothetical protein